MSSPATPAASTRFDLVLTDEVMPGMNGTAQLQQRAQAAGVRRVLAKPLQRDELARAIAGCLEVPL